jgi:transposase
MAVAAACEAMSASSLLQLLRNLSALFGILRTDCGMQHVSHLGESTLWNEFATHTEATRTRRMQLSAYSTIAKNHFPHYLSRLNAEEARTMHQYQLPPLPDGYLSRVGRGYEFDTRSQMQQQQIHQTVLPLVPALRQLVWSRMRVMEQVLHAFYHARRQVELGEASFPLAFGLSVQVPSLSVQSGHWELKHQERQLHFWLWNKRSFVLEHQERYSPSLIKKVRERQGAYDPKREQYFVEFDADPSLLLWFGDLVEYRLLQRLTDEPLDDPTFATRRQLAKELGCTHGCATSIPGLLQPDTAWLANHARAGDLLFEPEALYRGILYGAALVTLALTCGGTTNELLQISVERWVMTSQGQYQRLVPERAKESQEQRLFEINPQAGQMLQEIERGLVATHGGIPVMPVSHQISNYERLEPGGFFFQWQKRMLSRRDTEVLVVVLLHGVDVRHIDGTQIHLTMDQLRFGGETSLEERTRALKSALGFNQTILPHLSAQTLDAYNRALYAYFDFAESQKEVVFQPLTLVRWMVHLLNQGNGRDKVNRLTSIVQHLFREASALGIIDQDAAAALQSVKEIPFEADIASKQQEDTRPHLHFYSCFKKCGDLSCSVCREGGKKGHGPYWYAYWREDGAGHDVYIGRVKNDHTIAEALRKHAQRTAEGALLRRPGQIEQPDALTAMVPSLIQLIARRVELTQRMLAAFQQAYRHHGGGNASPPLGFQYADSVPELDPSGTIRERVVVLRFTLWDKRSWVLQHHQRFSEATVSLARRGTYAYSDDRNTPFVQFHGSPEDLWFGNLVAHNLLQTLEPHRRRALRARTLGFPRGCHTTRAGVLDTGDRWFSDKGGASELIFEPEALYRGTLFGAALAILSLANGYGYHELQQVSDDRWVMLHGTGGANTPHGEADTQDLVHLQALLPSRAHSEEDRHLFEVSSAALPYLQEVKHMLEKVHGTIPVVEPCPQIPQSALLRAERYLFQWATTADGSSGMLTPEDARVLVRFVLHGIHMPSGERLHVSTSMLRESDSPPGQQQARELKALREALLAPLIPTLSPSSLSTYRVDLYAYLRFAGSAEQAYQPETLKRWIAHLTHNRQGEPYDPNAIDHKVTPVRRSMVKAAEIGLLATEQAQAFNGIRVQRRADGMSTKRGPASKIDEAVLKWLTNLCQSRPGITAQELQVSYVLEFDRQISSETLRKARVQLNLSNPSPARLTKEDTQWIDEQCSREPAITARRLRERLAAERGKQVSPKKLNQIRASLGLRRPSDSPPGVQPLRPASYKLDDADIAWLLQQKQQNQALSGSKLQSALRQQRGKKIGAHAINVILRKHGLSTGRRRSSQQSIGS